MRLDGDAWQVFFDRFERSAWRLELLPVYTMPGEQERFQHYLATGEVDHASGAAWHDKIRGYVATGRTIGRVHVVRLPLTDYLKYEFAYQVVSVKAGEDIRILDLTDKPDPGLPRDDFWLFDEQRVVRMSYRPDGTQIGRELLEDADPVEYISYRDLALRDAVPLEDFLAGIEDSA